MSGELNDGNGQFNDDVPESSFYKEMHSTSELHSTEEIHSYSEFGKAFAKSKPAKTLTTSKGMDEALKYSSQVATVIKAVAAITVVAVVVLAPIIDEGSSIQLEFVKYGADETYVYYAIEIMDYTEDMDVTVTVHNDFISQTKVADSSFVEDYVSGLQPNMQYKITAKEGSKTIAEKTVWTTKQSSSPVFLMDYCTYVAADEQFHLLFHVNNEDWYGFNATVQYGDKSVGYAVFDDTEGAKTVPVDVSAWDNINDYTVTFRLWCKQTVDGKEESVELYSNDFTIHRVPHMTVSGKPVFDRSAGTLTVAFKYEDPNNVTYEGGIKAVVYCPAVGSDTYALCKPSDGTITVDVSSFIGYDVNLEISYIHKDDTTQHTVLYSSDSVPLYESDSVLELSGVHLEGTYRDILYLDMNYFDEDHVLSNITADVSVNDVTAAVGVPIEGLGTNPHLTLTKDVNSKDDVVAVTIHYSKHSPSSSVPETQEDKVYTGMSVGYVEPIFNSASGFERTTVRAYVPNNSMLEFTCDVDDDDSNWKDFTVSRAYYTTKEEPSVINEVTVVGSSFTKTGSGISCSVELPSYVPLANARVYISLGCTQVQRDGTETTGITVASDLEVPTIFYEMVPTNDNPVEYNYSNTPPNQVKLRIQTSGWFGVNDGDTCSIYMEYYGLDAMTGDEITPAVPTDTQVFTVNTSNVTTVTFDNESAERTEGHGYLTFVVNGKTLISCAYEPNLYIISG